MKFAVLVVPVIGYLFIPFSWFPLWVFSIYIYSILNFSRLRIPPLYLLILIPILYAILLSLIKTTLVLPVGHYLSLFTFFLSFLVYRQIFLELPPFSVLRYASIAFIILLAILVLEIIVSQFSRLGDLISFVRGSSGFGVMYEQIGRIAGSYEEPGHTGIAFNFFLPFYIVKNQLLFGKSLWRRIDWYFGAFIFPFTVLFFLASDITTLVYFFQCFLLLRPAPFDSFICFLSKVCRLRLQKFKIVYLMGFSFAVVVFYSLIRSSAKFIGLFSVLASGGLIDQGGDILSAGDRAARFLWAFQRIIFNPWGYGVAPFYRSSTLGATDFINGAVVNSGNYDSSLSLPLDILLFVGFPGFIFIVVFAGAIFWRLLRLYPCSFSRSLAQPQPSFDTVILRLSMVLALSLLFRYIFVANYWFVFLPFLVSFSYSFAFRARN